jgi:hypothetical protein
MPVVAEATWVEATWAAAAVASQACKNVKIPGFSRDFLCFYPVKQFQCRFLAFFKVPLSTLYKQYGRSLREFKSPPGGRVTV